MAWIVRVKERGGAAARFQPEQVLRPRSDEACWCGGAPLGPVLSRAVDGLKWGPAGGGPKLPDSLGDVRVLAAVLTEHISAPWSRAIPLDWDCGRGSGWRQPQPAPSWPSDSWRFGRLPMSARLTVAEGSPRWSGRWRHRTRLRTCRGPSAVGTLGPDSRQDYLSTGQHERKGRPRVAPCDARHSAANDTPPRQSV